MKLALATLGVCLTLAGCATSPGNTERHAAHHPPGTAVPAPGQMDGMMKSMQEMHDKMKAARTAEERAALMKEHMKLMQDGMAMMRQTRGSRGPMGMGMGGGMPMSPETMSRRMDMMEMMMQMMMDREAMKPPAAP